MARYAYDRLTALDFSFLALEKPNANMHVATVQIYEAGPLRNDCGGVDFDAVRNATEAVLHRVPRYRQKLRWIPLASRPVWVDDETFNLDYHLRHTSLPRPGSLEQLKRMAARIMEQQLDRSRPLWEHWIVEGLEGDRFALIGKVHHCMIDGMAGVDLMTLMLSTDREAELPDAPPFFPRPAPSSLELLRDELWRRASLPFDAVRDIRAFTQEATDVRREVSTRLRSIAETLGQTVRPASETPLNQPIGPHRRFDWMTTSLADIREIRKGLGGSVNDVLLATVAGAVQRFMDRRGVDPSELDFRVLAPVSVRTIDEQGRFGNRISAWLLPLPLDELDPARQLERIREQTERLKEARQAVGAEVLTQVAEWTPATLLSLGARNATRLIPFNMVVTNVPGPQLPLYMLGARLLEAFPVVPVTDFLGLGIALFSYDGRVFWGFNADWDLIPDLAAFRDSIAEAFADLQHAAGVEPRTGAATPAPEA